jgi:hypothetical protein
MITIAVGSLLPALLVLVFSILVAKSSRVDVTHTEYLARRSGEERLTRRSRSLAFSIQLLRTLGRIELMRRHAVPRDAGGGAAASRPSSVPVRMPSLRALAPPATAAAPPPDGDEAAPGGGGAFDGVAAAQCRPACEKQRGSGSDAAVRNTMARVRAVSTVLTACFAARTVAFVWRPMTNDMAPRGCEAFFYPCVRAARVLGLARTPSRPSAVAHRHIRAVARYRRAPPRIVVTGSVNKREPPNDQILHVAGCPARTRQCR